MMLTWSEESHMDECDPGAPLDMVAEVNTRRYDDFTHWAFTMAFAKAPVDVCIRGFSAGSYSGLSMCHLLWRMPHVSVRGTLGGIALPPALLSRIPVSEGERLLLYHYTSDTLCQWRPGPAALRALACKYCIVSNSEPELRGHLWQCRAFVWALDRSGSPCWRAYPVEAVTESCIEMLRH